MIIFTIICHWLNENERRVYLISLFGDLEGVGLKMIKNYYIFDTIIKSSYIYIQYFNIELNFSSFFLFQYRYLCYLSIDDNDD